MKRRFLNLPLIQAVLPLHNPACLGDVDFAADQPFTLTISKNQNPGMDFSGISDAVLALEYTVDLS